MNQIDFTSGNGAGRSEPVVPGTKDAGPRPASRITPQVLGSARVAEKTGDPRPAPARPDAATAPPTQPPRPNPVANDIAKLHAALTSGQDGLARKSDLGELHRQTVKLFQTLNKGLGEQQLRKAAEDRSALIARMERLEKSVNAMEGAVRIEMAPLMRSMLDEALEGHVARQGKRNHTALWLSFGIAAGVLVGVYFAGDIAPWTYSFLSNLGQIFDRFF